MSLHSGNALTNTFVDVMRKMVYVCLAAFCTAPASVNTGDMSPLKIIAGAESHGMLDACDCEHEPGGGVAKRATLVNKLGENNDILLLDAGGFSAGGIYDDYTEGRRGDSLRTVSMIKAMAAIGYDAAGIGDDDLQFGGEWLAAQASDASLPLVCANCFLKNGKLLAAPYIIVPRAGKLIGITAVCTPEKLFPTDSQISISDPTEALRIIWKELCEKTDLQIILSHTGQEQSFALAGHFPECELIVNGHRKTDGKPVTFSGTVPVMQFGFQGKSLSGLLLTQSTGKFTAEQLQWYDVVPELDDDIRIATILGNSNAPPVIKNNYDLYVMSQCPYGLEAIAALLEFTSKKQAPTWKIWFIGTMENDKTFVSLHGPAEIADEKLWLAIQDLYPDQWRHFLEIRATSAGDSRMIASQCGVDMKKIDKWINSNGNRELGKHYNRSVRQAIESSPTLLVNNRPFDRKINALNLMKFECVAQQSADTLCRSLPECGQDIDCKASQKIGTCNEMGKCSFKDDARFSFTIVIADSTIQHPEKMAIATTQELFPAAQIITLRMTSKDGRRLLDAGAAQSLPFYFFGNKIAQAHNFSRIEGGLKKINNGYTFKEGAVASNYYRDRKKKRGAFTLFIDPFFSGLPDILEILQSDTAYAQRITIEPVLFMEPVTVRPATEEFFRQEEALRWIVIGKMSKDAKEKYLNAYRLKPGSSFWADLLDGTGVHPDSVVRNAGTSHALLDAHWKTIISLSLREPVTLLIDNVETVAPGGVREMRRVLKRLIH
jgi:5'-nucleotidase